MSGATRERVVATILRSAARLLRNRLFGVSTYGPVTLVSAAILLAFCAAVAAPVPATRAARVDPIQALRVE
jgi:macrolide transport system ATP-binding/permease protein